MNVTDYLLDVLQKEGITHLFLVPGGYIDPLMTALKNTPQIKGIVAAHEGGAIFMADGFARASGKFGVAIGIGGPGITNMVTGIATAFTDGIPILIITGEAKITAEGRGAFQDSSQGGINDAAILQSITLKKLTVNDAQVLSHHLKQLLAVMRQASRQGPVHLSLPVDIQLQTVPLNYSPSISFKPSLFDSKSMTAFWPLLEKQTNIAILAGHCCVNMLQ